MKFIVVFQLQIIVCLGRYCNKVLIMRVKFIYVNFQARLVVDYTEQFVSLFISVLVTEVEISNFPRMTFK